MSIKALRRHNTVGVINGLGITGSKPWLCTANLVAVGRFCLVSCLFVFKPLKELCCYLQNHIIGPNQYYNLLGVIRQSGIIISYVWGFC